tara:strand:+ start:629 stop:1648 length:1020 start_codon:yes stop_codon:yes gene_type:complete
MIQENTYQLPKLYIDDKAIDADITGNVSYKGNNQLNNARIFIHNPDMQFDSLFNKSIKLFINSDDSIPVFRGFIKSYTADKKGININALDVRTVLTGEEGAKVSITDKNNFDGSTLGQFIHKFITNNINVGETVIGLNSLNDANPKILMKGVRAKNIPVYKIMTDAVSKGIDDSNIEEPLTFFIDVVEDGLNSNIVIVKEKSIDSLPSYSFSFTDGLQDVRFNRRNPANTVFYEGGSFEFGNRPTGKINTSITEVDDRAKNRALALQQVLIEQQQKNEIVIDISKCYDIGLGSIIHIDVEDDDIRGAHRVQSKNLTFGKSMSCQLQLNRKPVVASRYIN